MTASTELVNVASFSNPADKALINTRYLIQWFLPFCIAEETMSNTNQTVRELLTSDKWSGHAVVQARIAVGTKLTPQLRLRAVEKYLTRVNNVLVHNFQRSKGTNEFT